MEIDELLRFTVERGASDLHLKVGNVPFIRVDGELQPTDFDVAHRRRHRGVRQRC